MSSYDYDEAERTIRGPVLYRSEQVIDHFTHTRNVGEFPPEETDGYAKIGDAACGDEMELWISVRDGRIAKIAFKSFGCPGAISMSSLLTEPADGKTIEDAKLIGDDEVNALGGIPENKKHCSRITTPYRSVL